MIIKSLLASFVVSVVVSIGAYLYFAPSNNEGQLGATFLFPSGGGLGTSTSPVAGDLIMSWANGSYGPTALVAGSNITLSTSTYRQLSIAVTAGASSPFAWTPGTDGNSTSTRLIFGNGFLSQASSTFTGNATTTGMHGFGSIFLNGSRITDFIGDATLSLVSGALRVVDLVCTDCIGDTEISTHAGTSLAADLEEEVTEGSLADSTIVTADIKDGEIIEPDLNADDAPADADVLTYDSTGTNFVWETILDLVNTITGAVNWGGITSFEIPNGTSPTVDAIGEFALDTTENELLYATSTAAGAPAVIKPYKTIAFSYASSTQGSGTTTRSLGPVDAAGYFTTIQCDFNNFIRIMLYDGTNRMDDLVASSTIGTVDISTSNNVFTAGEVLRVDLGTTTNIASNVFGGCRAKFYYTRN